MEDIKYGWYSQTQKDNNKIKLKNEDNHYSSYIYLKEDGTLVEVTEITHNPNPKKYFKDRVYMGKVVKWVKSIKIEN